MVSFLQMANAVFNLEPSNHWIHESTSTLAKPLRPTITKSIFRICRQVTRSTSTTKTTGAISYLSQYKLESLYCFKLPVTIYFIGTSESCRPKTKTQFFQISHDQLLLEWQHDAERYSNGESLPRWLRDNQGHLKPDIAYIFRHVYIANLRLCFKCLNYLFASFFVMITGRVPTEEEFSSISTIRCHISRYNAIDCYDKGQEHFQRMEILSSFGNRRFFGSCSDDSNSKHGGGGSALNTHLLITSLDEDVIDTDSKNS
jgi:hypothetical protein